MKILVVGGGPAGLYFAILMKRQSPQHHITVLERNPANITFGWGVVFSGRTFYNLRLADEPTYDELVRHAAVWDNVDIVHRGEKISVHGNHFSAIARLRLLQILQARCRELGIELKFEVTVRPEDLAGDWDLVVGADGVNSTVRKHFTEVFQPSLEPRRNRYIWLGTRRLFDGLTLTFKQAPAGVFVAHSYKFDDHTSTFIVECSDKTWSAAGLGKLDESATLRFLEGVFAEDLQGNPLMSNAARWTNFVIVKNDRWCHNNVVLLGDALHTAHFSIGSGTKLALEDSIALADAFAGNRDVPAALAAFEQARKPVVDEYQRAALESLQLFEGVTDELHLEPIPFAYRVMTRSSRVDHEKLRQRDPDFVARYEQWQQRNSAAGGQA